MPSSNREMHTAYVLANGKVLIAAGQNGGGYLNSAELYDPSTGLWTLTGSMNYTRIFHTSSVLANGKVLVVGGSGSLSWTNTAELYAP